jgi:hypothetical protein
MKRVNKDAADWLGMWELDLAARYARLSHAAGNSIGTFKALKCRVLPSFEL